MVAASTPGWMVSSHGIIMPDPSYQSKVSASIEESTSSEERGSASTYTSASRDRSSYEDSDSYGAWDIDAPYYDPEPEPQYRERWMRPSPPLSAAVALALIKHFRKRGYQQGAVAQAVRHCRLKGCPPELVNESLMAWILNLIHYTNWNVIDIELVSRACAAELEDKIEEILRWEEEQQAPDDFNIDNASTRGQTLLAAYVKRLYLRREDTVQARDFFKSRQSRLRWQAVDDYAPSVYHHYANDPQNKQPRSVSPEGPVLASIGETKYIRGRAQPTRRQPKRASKGDAVDPIDLTS